MARIGYARVRATDEDACHQLDILRGAGCVRVFVDKGAGTLAARPALDEALGWLHAGDELVVTRLSRLGRSLRHLLAIVALLKEHGVNLVVLQQGLDTTGSDGRLLFHIMTALAEFERELIEEGTRDGLAAARARGRKGGRPPALSARQIAQARMMYDEVDADGNRLRTIVEIADTFGVSRTTVYRHLAPSPAMAAPALTPASSTRPPADYVPYGERRPYIVADSLAELAGPISGVVTLPGHLDWSGNPTYNLDTPGRLAELYQTVLTEASHVGDLRTWLNGERLPHVWPELWLPPKVRRLWEERFPELAAAHTAAPAA